MKMKHEMNTDAAAGAAASAAGSGFTTVFTVVGRDAAAEAAAPAAAAASVFISFSFLPFHFNSVLMENCKLVLSGLLPNHRTHAKPQLHAPFAERKRTTDS